MGDRIFEEEEINKSQTIMQASEASAEKTENQIDVNEHKSKKSKATNKRIAANEKFRLTLENNKYEVGDNNDEFKESRYQDFLVGLPSQYRFVSDKTKRIYFNIRNREKLSENDIKHLNREQNMWLSRRKEDFVRTGTDSYDKEDKYRDKSFSVVADYLIKDWNMSPGAEYLAMKDAVSQLKDFVENRENLVNFDVASYNNLYNEAMIAIDNYLDTHKNPKLIWGQARNKYAKSIRAKMKAFMDPASYYGKILSEKVGTVPVKDGEIQLDSLGTEENVLGKVAGEAIQAPLNADIFSDGKGAVIPGSKYSHNIIKKINISDIGNPSTKMKVTRLSKNLEKDNPKLKKNEIVGSTVVSLMTTVHNNAKKYIDKLEEEVFFTEEEKNLYESNLESKNNKVKLVEEEISNIQNDIALLDEKIANLKIEQNDREIKGEISKREEKLSNLSNTKKTKESVINSSIGDYSMYLDSSYFDIEKQYKEKLALKDKRNTISQDEKKTLTKTFSDSITSRKKANENTKIVLKHLNNNDNSFEHLKAESNKEITEFKNEDKQAIKKKALDIKKKYSLAVRRANHLILNNEEIIRLKSETQSGNFFTAWTTKNKEKAKKANSLLEEKYNTLSKSYNEDIDNVIKSLKKEISEYNSSVDNYNSSVENSYIDIVGSELYSKIKDNVNMPQLNQIPDIRFTEQIISLDTIKKGDIKNLVDINSREIEKLDDVKDSINSVIQLVDYKNTLDENKNEVEDKKKKLEKYANNEFVAMQISDNKEENIQLLKEYDKALVSKIKQQEESLSKLLVDEGALETEIESLKDQLYHIKSDAIDQAYKWHESSVSKLKERLEERGKLPELEENRNNLNKSLEEKIGNKNKLVADINSFKEQNFHLSNADRLRDLVAERVAYSNDLKKMEALNTSLVEFIRIDITGNVDAENYPEILNNQQCVQLIALKKNDGEFVTKDNLQKFIFEFVNYLKHERPDRFGDIIISMEELSDYVASVTSIYDSLVSNM